MGAMMKYKNITILLIDDDLVDVVSVKEALEERNISNPVFVAFDGVNALDILRGTNGCQRIPEPYIILLDLNMPRMNGLEFLEELRKDNDLKSSIVFVLTTSNADRDKIEAYSHNIAGYIVKSEVGEDFIHLVSLLQEFKLLVQFPVKDLI